MIGFTILFKGFFGLYQFFAMGRDSIFAMGRDPLDYNNGAMTNATTDINFNKILSDGPEVSLNGSPTVSPTTVALCGSDPL